MGTDPSTSVFVALNGNVCNIVAGISYSSIRMQISVIDAALPLLGNLRQATRHLRHEPAAAQADAAYITSTRGPALCTCEINFMTIDPMAFNSRLNRKWKSLSIVIVWFLRIGYMLVSIDSKLSNNKTYWQTFFKSLSQNEFEVCSCMNLLHVIQSVELLCELLLAKTSLLQFYRV